MTVRRGREAPWVIDSGEGSGPRVIDSEEER